MSETEAEEHQPIDFSLEDLDRMQRLLSAVHLILADTDMQRALAALACAVGSEVYQRGGGNPVAAMVTLSNFGVLAMHNVAGAFLQGLPIGGGQETSAEAIPPGTTVQ